MKRKSHTLLTKLIFGALSLSLILSTESNAQLSKCKDKYLGNIIAGSVNVNYNQLWNAVTSENACKWGSIEGTRNQPNWSGADLAYNHAKTNGMKFRWHAIAWGAQYPSWLSGLSPADFKAETEQWMKMISDRYEKGKYFDQIDVLNENLVYDPNGSYNPGQEHAAGTPLFRAGLGGPGATGYDWAIWLFETARKYFPTSKLVMNDFSLEGNEWSIKEMLKMVKVLKDRNLIDGFGTQAHDFNVNDISAADLKSNLDLMATSGLPIYVTELDISNANENTQRDIYKRNFPVYWEHPSVAGVTLWGYVTGTTWRDNTGIMTSSGQDEPAMTWLKSYMATAPCPAITGTNDEAAQSAFTLYPNPFNSNFSIESKTPFNYSIQNITGQTMEEGSSEGGSNVPMGSNLASGIYIVRINDEKNTRIIKVTKN